MQLQYPTFFEKLEIQIYFPFECLWKFANGVTKRKSLGSKTDRRMLRVIYIYTQEAHHVYDHFPQSLSLFLGQVDEDITVGVLKEFKGDGQMVVLEDGLVIIHDGQLGARVDQELVGQPRVVHVVDGRREDGGHHLQGREDTLRYRVTMLKFKILVVNMPGVCSVYLKCWRVEKDVSGLRYIGTVNAVMIRNI